jgi:hypothetical protein
MQSYVLSGKNRSLDIFFEELLSMGADSNMVLQDGSTLLHQAKSVGEVRALFKVGFTRINHKDDRGITPLMRVVKLSNTALVKTCMDEGAFVNEKDHRGWNVLHYIAEEIRDSTSFSSDAESREWGLSRHSEDLDTIRLLVKHGVNPVGRDRCRCACSLLGCTPSTILLGPRSFPIIYPNGDLWSFEWLQILSELGAENVGEQALVDFARVKQFEKHELTHVCCQRSRYSNLEEDDIAKILDKQSESIRQVDEIMQGYLEDSRDSVLERWVEELSLIPRWSRDKGRVSEISFL